MTVVLALFSIAVAWLAPTAAAASLPPQFTDETLVGGLDQPISMAFLPDGRVLFTERATGKIRMIVNGHIAATDPMATVPDVTSEYLERGLQGIAVDPRWPQSPYVYVCFTHTGDVSQLVRYTAAGDLVGSSGEHLTLGSPYTLLANLPDINAYHNGLGLRFAKDGALLLTTGDDGRMCEAQDISLPVGKLLRIDVTRLPAGSGGPPSFSLLVPPGNPFSGPDTTAQLVYAYGLRNPWRFHIDSNTGAILLSDVGWNDWEELDEISPGGNYGWPFREGPLVQQPGCGPDNGGYVAPIDAHSHAEGFATIMTAGVYRPTPGATANWPAVYWGNLFYADFYGIGPRRLVRSGSSWVAAAPIPGQPDPDNWATDYHYTTEWLVGADGSLYWLKMFDLSQLPGTGSFGRIRYTGPPVSVPAGPLAAHILGAVPNPFRGQVEITWRLPQPMPLEIGIFDLSGRRVRLIRQPARGLEGQALWDGRDDRGASLAAGVYVARIEGLGDSNWSRLVLIR
jgi:glucose/arabinose dehydrogenase